MRAYFLRFMAVLALFTLIRADCELRNALKSPSTQKETRDQLCLTMPPGHWTFAMDVSLVEVPAIFGGVDTGEGRRGNTAFIVYDHNCYAHGIYYPQQDHGCAAPYWIRDSYMPYNIHIKTVFMDVGAPYFKFAYANGEYSIRNNHAVCNSIPKGLAAEKGCRAAFPLYGEPK